MPENTPASMAQIDQLTTLIDHDLVPSLAATRKVVERSAKRSRIAFILSGISIVLILMAGGVVLQNRDAIHDANELRDEILLISCVQDNVSTQKDRDALVGSLITLADDPNKLTTEEQALVDAYSKRVEELLPFRDCSEDGIEAYYNNLPPDPALR
jgi:hypothetical protein